MEDYFCNDLLSLDSLISFDFRKSSFLFLEYKTRFADVSYHRSISFKRSTLSLFGFLHFSIVDVSLYWFPTNKKNPKQIIFFRILEENTFFTWIVVQVQVIFKSISVELSGVQNKTENDFELWAALNIKMYHLQKKNFWLTI